MEINNLAFGLGPVGFAGFRLKAVMRSESAQGGVVATEFGGAAHPDESGTHRPMEDRTGDPSAVTHPIEPSFRHLAESLSEFVWSARPDGYSDYYKPNTLRRFGSGVNGSRP